MLKNLGINLFRNKPRTLLTMTGITVGVFSVVLISSIGVIGTNQVSSLMADMGINSVLVQPKQQRSPISLGSEDIEAVRHIKGVSKAMPLMASNTETVLRGKGISCMAWGINNDAGEIISLEAKYGRLINSSDTGKGKMVCVIDEDIALATYGRGNVVGKTAKILLGGAYYDFEIIGVASSGMSMLQSALSGIIPNFVYIPFSTMQRLTGRTSYDKIAVLLGDSQNFDEIGEQIEFKLNDLRNVSSYDGVSAANLLQQKEQLEGIMNTVTFILSLIAGISLFVSGLTIMTTMLVAVGERTREIGIKKSVGARDSDIMREFLFESMLLALIGSFIGALLAVSASFVGCGILGLQYVPNAGGIVTPIIISVGLGILFGVYPALKAAKLEPIEALRN